MPAQHFGSRELPARITKTFRSGARSDQRDELETLVADARLETSHGGPGKTPHSGPAGSAKTAMNRKMSEKSSARGRYCEKLVFKRDTGTVYFCLFFKLKKSGERPPDEGWC